MEANKIIITGGATRIGAAIARKLSGKGVEIVIHYNKSKVKAEKLKKELSLNELKYINIPSNYLRYDLHDKRIDKSKDLVRRNGRLSHSVLSIVISPVVSIESKPSYASATIKLPCKSNFRPNGLPSV